jgi:hypothetical protein
MNSKLTPDFGKPTKFTAENYGTKISVELDHSDLDIDEVMDAFQTLIIGMGYHADSFKNWVIDRANEYNETDAEDLKEKLEAWKFEDDDIVLRHGYESSDELENDFFGSWDGGSEDTINERMDVIGQNGNEGLHYRVTDEDEDEFSDDDYEGPEIEDEFFDDGGFDGKPHFEWGDEAEDDENLFEGDEWKPNQKLVEANERYKSEVKKMNAKQKRKKKD